MESNDLELCPTCQKDYLRPLKKERYLDPSRAENVIGFICDFCGQRRINMQLESQARVYSVDHFN
jgi:hypothetical protein